LSEGAEANDGAPPPGYKYLYASAFSARFQVSGSGRTARKGLFTTITLSVIVVESYGRTEANAAARTSSALQWAGAHPERCIFSAV